MNVSVLVPYRPDDPGRVAPWAYVRNHYREHHPDWQICVGNCDGPWSKGRAVDHAAQQADHGLLVIADADSFTEPDLLTALANRVVTERSWAVAHHLVRRLDPADTERALTTGRLVTTNCSTRTRVVPGGGITILTRQAYDTVGGIDPRFEGWGAEDISFGWALDCLTGPHLQGTGTLWHLWHPPVTIGRRMPPAAYELNNRYRAVRHDPDGMRALIGEHRGHPRTAPHPDLDPHPAGQPHR